MSVVRALPLALLLLSAAPARADWWDYNHHSGSGGATGCTAGCGVFFGITFGLDLLIDVVDVVNLAGHDPMSPGWSVVQGLWGLAHTILGAVVTAGGGLGLALGADGAGPILALGLVTLGEGILLIILAVVTTVHYVRERRLREEERRHPAIPIASFSVDPRGGATALLSWRF